ncbi:MAG: DNA-directed RNA polymerase subunit beta [Deltaproteobacteria bacterium GWA2_57_13]|nr:MAG: DNA-directed RNA polymerase subunit beta [Deltaproteobacteria bacterium GWA2_57_13]OGQ52339.1 MAG: DNA-directed RNA polymerase subunit beta [Deltaproteobacteria bacterium RIFCSPLOWO2_02_FULL_57_26]
MAFQVANNLRFRRNFGRIKKIIDLPYLIEIQKNSYDLFLQKDVPADQRQNGGLHGVFRSVFPIKDFNETASLEFVSYKLGEPKYDVEECHQRGMTFAAPLKVTVQLILWDVDPQSGSRSIKNVKEQEVYFGEVPLMTKNGTFMINGTERVIVSQLHRSPGAFFEHDKGKTHASGKLLYSARVIPYRGSWLDFEFDPRDILYVRIDRRRKFHATALLRALGMTTEDLLNYYYKTDTIVFDGRKPMLGFNPEQLIGIKAGSDVRDPKSDELIVKEGKKLTRPLIRQMEQARIKHVPIAWEDLLGRVSARDIVDPRSSQVLVECNQEITQERLDLIREKGITEIQLLFIEESRVGPFLRNTLLQDRIRSPQEALVEIYRRLRPGDPPTLESATTFFNNLFFNADRYDLSKVGRLKLNHRLKVNMPLEQGTLRKEDILEVVRYLMELRNGIGSVDDIDHLGNRRVRPVGELVENHFRVGLVRMERAIKEKMSLQDIETLMPQELINYKPVSAALKEFFGSSQLSQFMDQTNPLSEITHKRRLSALGPGGLTRERAGFEVRDVHPTHYGRVCPIETPEGPNIGLIASLTTYARVNEFGFIETPYREVESGRVTDRIRYLSALEEEDHVIAQANAPLDSRGYFTVDLVSARKGGEFIMGRPDEVDFMDVSPNQLVSVAASLIPFLENDDANRALMGSNMQRQAVPLLRTEAPLVGTGMEKVVARDSGVTVVAVRDGVVESEDSTRIVVKADRPSGSRDTGVDIYNLVKYQRSNQNTCINQRPIVVVGDHVKAGDVIADGPSTEMGELALGRNVLVAFMPWGGYNFEDSILISERVVKEDIYTSIHIEEFECVSRDTKLGPEEITRDIPNVGDEALAELDESGIIRIGAEVKPGDILVGKITPKGETQLSPEEKLLRAIFGEKAGEVRDTSLRVPPGVEGTVINVRIFSRKGLTKDERSRVIEDEEIARLKKDQQEEVRIIQEGTLKRLKKLFVGRRAAARVSDDNRKVLLNKGKEITEEDLEQIPMAYWGEIRVDNEAVDAELKRIVESTTEQIDLIKLVFQDKMNKLKSGDELPPGVIKMVKVFVAIKRKLQVGDKMAGRHGNKGVISRILPEEDMPYLEDGTPVDIVLNPLGVPSRMNVGQILEAHLGWAARSLGQQIGEQLHNGRPDMDAIRHRLKECLASRDINEFVDGVKDPDLLRLAEKYRSGVHLASPVFDGATQEETFNLLRKAGLPVTGQVTLHDGRSGVPFDEKVTVGVMYIMKLHHLVDDKIHARSTGPYSLVTQQPLGGKAQFGGQRLGEMEVWALEAYGAAFTLQEMLTVKSDDVIGRTRMYEAIVKGENLLEPGLPESFNVMIKELQSLGLDVELLEEKS